MSILLPRMNLFDASKLIASNSYTTCNLSDGGYRIELTATNVGTWNRAEYAFDTSLVQNIAGKTVYFMANSISKSNPDATEGVQLVCNLDDGTTKYFLLYSDNLTRTCNIPENTIVLKIQLYTNKTGTSLIADNTTVVEGLRLTFIENAPWEAYRSTDKVKLFLGEEKVKKVYLGDELVYSAGNIVTYMVDTEVTYTEEVDCDASCLNPTTFTPMKSGWTFVGWREDTTASGSVLSDKMMGDDPITLYAVFKQNITLSYDGNGSTSGSVTAQTAPRYYNNGNINNPVFVLVENAFSRTDYTFTGWDLGDVGSTVTLSANTTAYAQWFLVVTDFAYTEDIQSFTAPITGTYQLEVWGAQGGGVEGYKDYGGLGGYSKGNVHLTKGQKLYVVVGGRGENAVDSADDADDPIGGYNGGGDGSSAHGTSGIWYIGGAGGGATHIATGEGLLSTLSDNKEAVLIVAGAGGGAKRKLGWKDSGGHADANPQRGGTGGGLAGGKGTNSDTTGGSQTEGGNGPATNPGTFGQGGNHSFGGAGGGSGWYGGAGENAGQSGSGGSGYIDGVTDGSTENGIQAGHGKATITLIAIA